MLIYDDKTFGILECKLNLEELYPAVDERRSFYTRLNDFLKSDGANQDLYSLQGDTLRYRSEVFVSSNKDPRPPLLLLLGNPASHSVSAGMCFAFERVGLEHRFWRALKKTGTLTFLEQPPKSADPAEKNEVRRNALLEHKYLSPFRVGIAVFYTMPSSASDPKWSGVTGIRKLLGAKAFGKISLQEEKRMGEFISRYMGSTGGIIAFQKDAYNGVRSHDAPAYSLDLAKRGLLLGKYKGGQHIFLAGSPPTRLALTAPGIFALRQCNNWLSQQFIDNPW